MTAREEPGAQVVQDGLVENVVEDGVRDVAAERSALIQLCVYALDRARSPGVTERIESGLAEIGVAALRPEGERFDPALHEAGGVVATEDPGLDGIIAETELTGFADRGEVLRVPVVTVYQVGG